MSFYIREPRDPLPPTTCPCACGCGFATTVRIVATDEGPMIGLEGPLGEQIGVIEDRKHALRASREYGRRPGARMLGWVVSEYTELLWPGTRA